MVSIETYLCTEKNLTNVFFVNNTYVNSYILGKLTTDQVKAGYASLKKIETCVNKADFGQKLVQACNEFYTRIPHTFG